MSVDAWLTLGVVLAVLVVLATDRCRLRSDVRRLGLPLTLTALAFGVVLIPLGWPR